MSEADVDARDGHDAGGPGSAVRATQRGPRVPLRITLVALLVVLLAAALCVTGVAATSLLRGYLVEQQDAQLRATAEVVRQEPWRVLRPCREDTPQAPSYDYVACLPPGEQPGESAVVVWGPVRDGGSLPDLGRMPGGWPGDASHGRGHAADRDDAIRVATVPARDGDGSWRVAATPLPDGYTAVLGVSLARDEEAIARLVAIEVVVGLIVLTLLGSLGYLLVRNSLRPLGEVERTARAIAAGDLSQRVPAGDERTEVGRLTTALNGMLARIESAFRAQQESEAKARGSAERMRRFVADASHELRTPLTSIRGFAELYRQGAVRDPDDVRRLMQRIEAEGARMGLLVEDLLLLARLDQQRPLVIVPVDLAEIAGDAVHDARAVQPDRPIELRLDGSLTEVPVVLGDEARLRQVIGNLLTNALTHTPRTAAVTVILAEEADDPDAVVLRVSDEGPGLSAEDAERVFERFYRADTSRTRAAGGTGLGLAIVSSLVAAHGGTVQVETAEGRGATFTVRLPRSGPPDDDQPG